MAVDICRSTTFPPSHTHMLESKEKKNNILECKENDQMLKNPDMKNVNKRKNSLTPVKLESKKQDKKKHSPGGRD